MSQGRAGALSQKEQTKNLLGIPIHKMLDEVSATMAVQLAQQYVSTSSVGFGYRLNFLWRLQRASGAA